MVYPKDLFLVRYYSYCILMVSQLFQVNKSFFLLQMTLIFCIKINSMQLSPEGEVNSGGLYRDAKRRSIYPPPFTDLEGDSCFSIYQIRSINKCCFNFFFCNCRETMRHFFLRSQNSEYPRIFRVTDLVKFYINYHYWNQLSTKNLLMSATGCLQIN